MSTNKLDLFEVAIEEACNDGVIPGAVLVASKADGSFHYEKAFGVRSLKDQSPMKIDATFFTTVAVMQCVEKGLLKLDEDVTSILPELKKMEILKGFEEDTQKPILVPSTKEITLRHLLTHQSGIGYDFWNPTLLRFQKERGVTPSLGGPRSIVESYDHPLLFEPGESWEYSVGLEWAGEMIMRVTKMSLEAYMQKYIWGPLSIRDITFFPKKSTSVMEKLVDMSQRDGELTMYGTAKDPDGGLTFTEDMVWDLDTVVCHGGAGAFGGLVEYQKILHSICADDGKLLRSETIEEMFKPQLTEKARAKMNELNSIPEKNQVYGGPHGLVDWGIGGMMTLDANPGRSAGSMTWGGYANQIWVLDRVAGISAILGTHIIPPGDLQVVKLMQRWMVALYEEAGVKVEGKS